MNVQEVFGKLLDYQEILTEKFEYEEQMEELPKVLSSKNEVLNRIKKAYLSKYYQFKKMEENIDVYRKKMNEMKLRLQELDEKSKLVSSQKEYEAIDKEVALTKQKEDEYSFQLMQEERIVDDLKGTIEDYELSMKQQEEEIEKEQEKVNKRIEEIKGDMENLGEKETSIIDELDEDFRYKFEKIVKNRDGHGIVSVSRGHCTGCYTTLPVEYINNVRSNDKIYFCPYCSRVLYYDESPENIFALDEEEMDDSEFFDIED